MAISYAVTVDAVNIPGPITATQQKAAFTLSFWIFFRAFTAGTRTFYGYSINGAGAVNTRCLVQWVSGVEQRCRVGLRSPDTNAQGSIETAGQVFTVLNRWYHVAAVVRADNSTGKIYIDGALSVSGALTNAQANASTDNTSTDDARICGRVNQNPGTEGIDGKMEGARLYNGELTANQIKSLFTGKERVNVQLDKLLHWYPMQNQPPGVLVSAVSVKARGPVERINGTNQGTPSYAAGVTWPRRRLVA